MWQWLRQIIIHSPLGFIAGVLVRFWLVLRNLSLLATQSARWLANSREHTNFTYELSALNRLYLAHWVANVAEVSVGTCLQLFTEIESDHLFQQQVECATKRSSKRWLSDRTPKLGRRLAWYALVRLFKPDCVIETGCDKGLGTLVLLRALEKNASGHVYSIDVNPRAGWLLEGYPATRVTLLIGDSLEEISNLPESSFGIFLHDSLHTYEHEKAEFELARSKFRKGLFLSDNSEASSALADWAHANNLTFHFFAEDPEGAWPPGGGIGLAM